MMRSNCIINWREEGDIYFFFMSYFFFVKG